MKAILFDLGNTLVSYYEREDFPAILGRALRAAYASLAADGYRRLTLEEVLARAPRAESDPEDLSIRPLEDRFEALFELAGAALPHESYWRAARAFVGPMQAPAVVYPDTIPTLGLLRDAGVRVGIVSNLPWGVPSELWRGELARHAIEQYLDFTVFCADIGRRKPSPAIFRAALDRLGVAPGEALFVGDEPEWDVGGAERAGIPAVLMDRNGRHPRHAGARVTSLAQLVARLGLL
jgi:putative hydrolase of the HAD superfamily